MLVHSRAVLSWSLQLNRFCIAQFPSIGKVVAEGVPTIAEGLQNSRVVFLDTDRSLGARRHA